MNKPSKILFIILLPGILILLIILQPLDEKKSGTTQPVNTHLDRKDTSANKKNLIQSIDSLNTPVIQGSLAPFPSGSVSKGNLTDYLTKMEWGHILSFTSKTPVASPAIYANRLFVPGGFGSTSYYSFDLESGQLIWAIDLNDDGPSAAVFQDSTLVFNTESCTLFAIDLYTGKMRWSHWLGDPLLSVPTASDHQVFTAYPGEFKQSGSGNLKKQRNRNYYLACFDLRDGRLIWQKPIDDDVMVAPVVHKNHVYVTTFSGTVYKFDKNGGALAAQAPVRATSPPYIFENEIYITKRADEVKIIKESIASLDQFTLKIIKEFNAIDAPYLDFNIQEESVHKYQAKWWDIGNGFTSDSLVSNKAAEIVGLSNVASLQLFQPSTILKHNEKIVVQMGETISCMDIKTGNLYWKYAIDADLEGNGGSAATMPILTDHYLVTVSIEGTVVVLDIETGTKVFEQQLGEEVRTAPLAVQGYVLVPTISGQLNVINTGLKELTGWTMFMKNPNHKM